MSAKSKVGVGGKEAPTVRANKRFAKGLTAKGAKKIQWELERAAGLKQIFFFSVNYSVFL